MNRKNLRKLANYLLNLPEDYTHFDMGKWCANGDNFDPIHARLHITDCGTSGCAAGHGPAAGMPGRCGESWRLYIKRVFDLREGPDVEWDWCFEGLWERIDNTPQGAALRILYVLDEGLPDGFHWRAILDDGKKYKKLYTNTYDIVAA